MDEGIIYIDKEHNSIVKFSGKINAKGMVEGGAFNTGIFNLECEYGERIGDVLFPTYGHLELAGNLSPKWGSVPVVTNATMFFHNYSDKHKGRLKKVNRNTNDQDEISKKKYHPDFWKNNPIIKRIPIEDNIIKSFEKEALFGALTDQVK